MHVAVPMQFEQFAQPVIGIQNQMFALVMKGKLVSRIRLDEVVRDRFRGNQFVDDHRQVGW